MAEYELFGEIAVRLGFAQKADVDKALAAQAEADRKGERRKLIGLILLESGALDTTQLILILKEMDGQRRVKS
ncbi:MAG: hypothetical protein RDV41_01565 [Planctomycetota bacterium]|nr:hypothetical protein [Planctomycetota bacterium]